MTGGVDPGSRASPRRFCGRSGTDRPPPWTWTLDRAEARRIAAIAGVAGLRAVPLPRGRGGGYGFLVPLATRVPFARTALLSIWAARFETA